MVGVIRKKKLSEDSVNREREGNNEKNVCETLF